MPNRPNNKTVQAILPATQRKIFRFAEKEQVELADALEHFGYSYDHLRYETSSPRIWKKTSPKSLGDFRVNGHSVPMVSFFAGCGGIDLGFEAAGFKHMAAFEFNELFCKTLKKNRPEWRIFGPPEHSGDVSETASVIETLEKVIPLNFEGVFTGGPPCQPFSIAANQRFAKSGKNFKRIGFAHKMNGNLILDYVALIKYFRPACFLIENVPGLRDLDDGKQLAQIVNQLKKAGYAVEEPTVLNASNYGVPQHRNRLFIIGSRKKRAAFPLPEKSERGSGLVLPRNQSKAENSETRTHSLKSVMRYARLDYGQRDQLGRVDRLDPSRPSKTIIAGGTAGGGRSHLHPEIPRTLSVRECARLQTFPDSYIFAGSIARQFTQVGNAVPPVLASQLGLSLAKSVFGIRLC